MQGVSRLRRQCIEINFSDMVRDNIHKTRLSFSLTRALTPSAVSLLVPLVVTYRNEEKRVSRHKKEHI